MTTMKEKKAEALTRMEQEVVSCQEEMRRVAKERNALLSQSLKSSLEKGIIALENGNILIQASLLFPRNGADLTAEGISYIKSIGKGLQDVLDTGDAIMVSGFTDDTPTNSSTYTNWNLSTERAVNVVKTLIDQGFSPERLFAADLGNFIRECRTRAKRTASEIVAWKSGLRRFASQAPSPSEKRRDERTA